MIVQKKHRILMTLEVQRGLLIAAIVLPIWLVGVALVGFAVNDCETTEWHCKMECRSKTQRPREFLLLEVTCPTERKPNTHICTGTFQLCGYVYVPSRPQWLKDLMR